MARIAFKTRGAVQVRNVKGKDLMLTKFLSVASSVARNDGR